ncbi:MAG: gliding motility-associated C-terminal domain-containing protein [Bacteroidota bacterium]|nr:gliding motility-associated C-terminal domain-containing protein [Bacteroidota bacterium]
MIRLFKIFFLLIFFSSYNLYANHIVGGEIELIHIGDENSFRYQVSLIQYFDCAQTANPGPDNVITYTIFRKSDGAPMRNGSMFVTNQEFVPYTNPDCALGFLCTLKVEYSHEITLDPEDFNDPDGYVIVWERCCRNWATANLVDPGWNGMTYTLHFPPVVDASGKPFVNSSPRLFPPLSDYACINQLFYIDFAGTDDDGDSIVYSLAAPLDDSQPNNDNIDPVPDPQPPPHPIVDFAPGFDVASMVPGNPSLSISNDGFITVTPTATGLYVFSVKAEEYRDGMKIGEARRDFQMLVVDGCDPPDPPEALVKVPGQLDYYKEDDTIIYVASVPKCFDLFVTDDVGTDVTLTAEGVNFGKEGSDLSDIFSFSEGSINAAGDTLKVEVCVSDCPYIQNEPYLINLIAADDACPLPQRDTVTVTIIVEPPTNSDPYFLNVDDTNYVSVPWNSNYTTLIEGMDSDLDSLSLDYFIVPEKPEYDLADYGISFNASESGAGSISGQLTFDTNCRQYDYKDKSNFMLGVVLDDLDTCDQLNQDTIYYDLTVELPVNTGPKLTADKEITDSVDSRPNFSIIEVETDLSGAYSLQLFSDDIDNDTLTLNAYGIGFELADINAGFAAGNSSPGHIEGNFAIDFECVNFPYNNTNEYKINFITEDVDFCQESNADTIQLIIKINIDENADPIITNESEYNMTVNKPFEIDINATDSDNDLILLELISSGLPGQFSFEQSSGVGQVTSKLIWSPTCEFLQEDFSPKAYNLTFKVTDNSCPFFSETTKQIKFLLEKPDTDWGIFNPPNAFSPDGDGINDSFTLTSLNNPNQNLPVDACDDNFESIVFVDRTGIEVYKSYDKNFKWDGSDLSPGVYFYYIKYTKSDYRGTVTIVY